MILMKFLTHRVSVESTGDFRAILTKLLTHWVYAESTDDFSHFLATFGGH